MAILPASLRPSVKACALLCSLLFSVQAANAVPVYFNDFQTAVGANLSSTSGPLALDATNSSTRNFLGRADGFPTLGLNNETVTLSLTGLAPHTLATISLSLFIIQSWDGNNGPDIWQAGHSGSLTNLQDTTFAIASGNQCFPSDCPANNAARTGADEPSDSLGYTFFGDSVYNLSYTFAHTGSSLTASFTGANLQFFTDESWGIDDLLVETNQVTQAPINRIPEPASLALLGLGLAALAASRRKAG